MGQGAVSRGLHADLGLGAEWCQTLVGQSGGVDVGAQGSPKVSLEAAGGLGREGGLVAKV